MRWLKVLAILQWLILLPLLLRFLLAPLDFSALGLWLLAVAVAALTVPVGAWQAIRHPPRRVWAYSLVVLGLSAVALPLVLSHFDVAPIPLPAAVVVTAALALLASAGFIAQAAFRSGSLMAGRSAFDTGVAAALLIAPPVALLPWISVAIFGFPAPVGRPSSGPGFDLVLIYSVAAASAAGLIGLYGLVHSLVGLRRDADHRGRHLVRMLLALVALLLGVLLVPLIGILITNPG